MDSMPRAVHAAGATGGLATRSVGSLIQSSSAVSEPPGTDTAPAQRGSSITQQPGGELSVADDCTVRSSDTIRALGAAASPPPVVVLLLVLLLRFLYPVAKRAYQ